MHSPSYTLISISGLDLAPIMHKLLVADLAPVHIMPMRGSELGFKSGGWNNAALFTVGSLDVMYGCLSRTQ